LNLLPLPDELAGAGVELENFSTCRASRLGVENNRTIDKNRGLRGQQRKDRGCHSLVRP
jgi:hypothetical protein